MSFCSFSEDAAMFDVTPIENMFLLEYLPTAPEDYLRVYLYARMLCLHPELGGELGDVARALRMEEDAVCNAFAYWERQGLIDRLTDRPPSYAVRPLRMNAAPQSDMDRDYYEYREYNSALQALFGAEHLLQPKQYKMANDWLNVLGLAQDAALRILTYEYGRGRGREPASVFKRADKRCVEWAERGVRTLDDVERAIAYDDRVYALADKVMKQLSLNRRPSVNELDCVRRWIDEWKLDDADVLAACAQTVKSRTPSIGYLDAILKARADGGSDAAFEAVKALLRELGAANGVPTPDQLKRYAALTARGFEPEALTLAAVQCARKRKNSFEELEWMAGKWDEAGVHTRAQAEKYIDDMQENTRRVRLLLERAGLARRPGMDDVTRYEAWSKRYSPELIDCAAELSRGTGAPMRYMAKLLEEWEKAGISTPEAARAQHAGRSSAEKSAERQNYQQHSYTQADFDQSFFYNPSADYKDGGEDK